MRSNFTFLLITFISLTMSAQKDQIKQARAEFKNGNSQGAISLINKWEYLMINAPYEDKSEFYNLKAEVYKSFADKNIDVIDNLGAAIEAYNILLREEKLSGEYKYTVKAVESIKKIKEELQDSARSDVNQNKFLDGAKKMYSLYNIDKKDTINLYLSTSYFMSAKDYVSALRNYKELNSLNYNGGGKQYFAKNKKNNNEELFESAADRDASVKAGTHDNPRNDNAKSKKNEIYQNIAYIYSLNGELSQAENFYKQSIAANPKFIDPYVDLAYLGLEKKKLLSDKISVLGTSKADMLVYDDLKLKMDNEVKIAISYLETANKMDPKNTKVSELLLKLYRAMDYIAEYNALKARI